MVGYVEEHKDEQGKKTKNCKSDGDQLGKPPRTLHMGTSSSSEYATLRL